MVRFAYLPRFRDPDFLWATTDIAIWSTVEQGLAVAAGSMATLRPLVKLIGYKLGLTSARPSHMGRSGYGNTYGKMNSQSGHLSHRRNGSHGANNVLTLNSLKGDSGSEQSPAKFATSYEVRVDDRTSTKKSENDGISLSNVIAHSKTYEVSSEYITHPPTPGEKSAWTEKKRVQSRESVESSESTRRLRSEFLADPIYGQNSSPV